MTPPTAQQSPINRAAGFYNRGPHKQDSPSYFIMCIFDQRSSLYVYVIKHYNGMMSPPDVPSRGALSPKRSSAVFVESFSLMMGTTPSARHSMMVVFLRPTFGPNSPTGPNLASMAVLFSNKSKSDNLCFSFFRERKGGLKTSWQPLGDKGHVAPVLLLRKISLAQ